MRSLMRITSLLIALLGLVSSLHAAELPQSNFLDWHPTMQWDPIEDGYIFMAQSDKLIDYCEKNPNAWVQFPNMVYGIQELHYGNKLVTKIGSPSFKEFIAIYEEPEISCIL